MVSNPFTGRRMVSNPFTIAAKKHMLTAISRPFLETGLANGVVEISYDGYERQVPKWEMVVEGSDVYIVNSEPITFPDTPEDLLATHLLGWGVGGELLVRLELKSPMRFKSTKTGQKCTPSFDKYQLVLGC